MKRWIIFILIAIALGAGLGELIEHDKGYMMIAFHDWVLEMSVWMGYFVADLLPSLIVMSIKTVFGVDSHWRDWSSSASVKKLSLHNQGLLNLVKVGVEQNVNW